MLTQHPLQKKILIDVQRRVLAGAGQQMYYGIKDIALRIPLDQIKFAAAFFNGNKAPVIGHIGQQPGHDRGLAGAGGAGNADGHPISDTGSQKVKHFSGGTAGVQQFFFTDGLLIDDTDGGIDAYICIHNGSFVHRNTDVLVQKSHNAGHSIINDHAAGVEHSADHIDGVLGRTEFIRDLDTAPTGFDHFNVVVGVDVDLLNTGLIDPFLQKGVAGHVFIELGTQFFCRESVKGIFAFDNVVFHQFFQQACGTLCIAFPSFGNGGGMVFGKIPLYILQYLVIGQLLIGGRCEEYIIQITHRHPPHIHTPHPPLTARPVPFAPEFPVPCSVKQCIWGYSR